MNAHFNPNFGAEKKVTKEFSLQIRPRGFTNLQNLAVIRHFRLKTSGLVRPLNHQIKVTQLLWANAALKPTQNPISHIKTHTPMYT